MRRGIGLRGYAQQDPLNEFRKEAFRLYEELSGFIRRQVATTIFRVTLTPAPAPAAPPAGVFPLAGPGQAARPAALGAGAGGGAARRRRDTDPRRCGPPRRRRGGRRVPGGERGAGPAGPAGPYPDGREDRSQRSLLVWLGAQVQEVPRPLMPPRG